MFIALCLASFHLFFDNCMQFLCELPLSDQPSINYTWFLEQEHTFYFNGRQLLWHFFAKHSGILVVTVQECSGQLTASRWALSAVHWYKRAFFGRISTDLGYTVQMWAKIKRAWARGSIRVVELHCLDVTIIAQIKIGTNESLPFFSINHVFDWVV